MSFIYLFLVGILIGTGMIVPGVSGGVIAVIFGVYNKMIYSLTNLFKDFKKNFMFLAVLGTGILVGAIWFSNIILFLYERHEIITKFSFVGLILGGVPFLYNEIKLKQKQKINYVLIVLTFVLSLALWYFSNNIFKIDLDKNTTSQILNFFNLFLAGIIYSVGKVIPGISSSFLLIIIGMYEYVLSVMAHPITVGLRELNKLFPFLIGLSFGVVILLKIINYLLKNHFGSVYSIIIGFVLGSIPALIPGFEVTINYLIGVIVCIFSFILSYKLSK